MPMSSISIIIPAHNEEKNLVDTTFQVREAFKNSSTEYEILIIDDCSHDKTAEIGQNLQAEHNNIHYYRNDINLGFAGTYLRGVNEASKSHCMYVPGDNDLASSELKKITQNLGQSDLVISYPENIHQRKLSRRIISKTYTHLLNIATGLRLPYYNGFTIFKKDDLKSLHNINQSFSFQADILIRLIKTKSKSFKAVAIRCNFNDGHSSAFKIKNIIGVIKFVLTILFIKGNSFEN